MKHAVQNIFLRWYMDGDLSSSSIHVDGDDENLVKATKDSKTGKTSISHEFAYEDGYGYTSVCNFSNSVG